MSTNHDFESLLRAAGLKVTDKRTALLGVLSKTRQPMSVSEIKKVLGKAADSVTIYRALEAFVQAKIVARVDFHEDEARFELIVGREHHHHVVCGSCGIVEDIDACSPRIEREVLRSAKQFSVISGHALEFFGTCRNCIIR